MQNQFKQIVLIYGALMLAQVLFCLLVIFVVTAGPDPTPKGMGTWSTLLPLVMFGLFVAAFLVYKKRKQEGATLSGLSNKVEHYRAAAIIRSSMLEGANLMAVIFALVTNDLNPLLWFSLGLFLFLYFRPSAEEFIRDYALSTEEEQELRRALSR